ncbi:NAD(P)-dependent oxidoreductase [Nakamurella alba]|nr:NAD(P)-dependent oxidoreductase [Nakamurella alba]
MTSPQPPGSGTTVAVFGLGRMGVRIASRLADAGLTVRGYDPIERSAALSFRTTSSPGDAVLDADLVLTALPGSPELQELAVGSTGLIDLLPPGCAWIDLTSTSPVLAHTLGQTAATSGVPFLKAPMGGGPSAAENGTLQLYVGGDPDLLERWRPVLAAFSNRMVHIGSHHAAGTMKLLVNQLWFGQAAMVAEAALLATTAGIPPGRFRDLVLDGPAASTFLERDWPGVLAGDYLHSFGLDRVVEELDSLLWEADRHDLPHVVGDAVARIHREALQHLGPDAGELGAVAFAEAQAGRRLRDPVT